jgi:NDP-sugar pyrophosphorylase family protein
MIPCAILCGGLGTRLGDLTRDTPKCLVEVAGVPFLFWQLDLLRSKGITHIVLCLGHQGDMIEKALTLSFDSRGIDIKFSYDGEDLLGTGGAILKALPMLGDRFFVTYGDGLLDCDYAAVVQHHEKEGRLGTMVVFREQGNVLFRNGLVKAYSKTIQDKALQHTDWGLSVFEAKAFGLYKQGSKFDLGSVFQNLARQRLLAGYEVPNRYYEVGSLLGICRTIEFLQSRDRQP